MTTSEVASAAFASSSASDKTFRPSAHDQRYDRQLRLWASSGQASLESAHVLVLGASYLSACVVKNLVLPGMGSFDIVDARLVDEADVGGNFFIDNGAKGKSRAKEVTLNLCELNPEVKGVGIQRDPCSWIEENDLNTYTLVIAVNQPNDVLVQVAEKAWDAKAGVGVPLMAVRGAGLIGEISIQTKELGIIETHPESMIDLRLVHPWPALQAFAHSFDVNPDDSLAYSHIPNIVILLRKLHEWREAHDDKLPSPSSSDERKAFIDSINSFRQGANVDEENVDEAIAALGQHVWRPIRAATEKGIPSEISALLIDERCVAMTDKTSNFWLLVGALKEFVRHGDGSLPVTGSLPDIKAQSATYVELQRIYRAKAQEDTLTLRKHLDEILVSVGLPNDAISQDETESFAKHAAYLRLLCGNRFSTSLEQPNVDVIGNAFSDPVNPVTIPWHVALVASQDFYAMHSRRYPGSTRSLSTSVSGALDEPIDDGEQQHTFEEDEATLIDLATKRLQTWGCFASLTEEQIALVEDACSEITRSGHADLPSTAALLGGVAAQEAIKLVTRQYVPLDNTAVYDGIKQAIGVFRL